MKINGIDIADMTDEEREAVIATLKKAPLITTTVKKRQEPVIPMDHPCRKLPKREHDGQLNPYTPGVLSDWSVPIKYKDTPGEGW